MTDTSQSKLNTCPLCKHAGSVFYDKKNLLYYQCENCSGIFIDRKFLLNPQDEKARYQSHNNNVEDEGYQKFVSPITSAILNDFSQKHTGLDFGAGTGPVISKILDDNSFQIKQYDPFFHIQPNLLEDTYNYIACCEVMEHFHEPNKEFALLRSLLKPKGKLYCLTHIYEPSITFHNWYYMNDRTHVFFYHKDSIEWIKKEFGFSKVTIEGKLITFSD